MLIYKYLPPFKSHNTPVYLLYMHIVRPRRLHTFPWVSAGHLQMNVLRRCCDAPPRLSYHLQFGQISIAATSHSLSALTCRCAWVCLIVAPVHVCDRNRERGKKANYFLMGRHLFQTSLEFAYSDSNEISCKTAVIIGTFSSGTQL